MIARRAFDDEIKLRPSWLNDRQSSPKHVSRTDIASGIDDLTLLNPLMTEISGFETKVIRWKNYLKAEGIGDFAEDVQEMSILLQSENGPCPLVALVNTIILNEAINSPTVNSKTSSLASYTYGKDHVTVDSILSRLGDILAESLSVSEDQSHADEVFSLLPKLVTGLNVNPRFDGSFERGPSTDLFKLYGVNLVHGWICNPKDDIYKTLQELAPSYDEAQSLLVRANQNPQDDDLQAHRYLVEGFLQENATELTEYGLKGLTRHLIPSQPQVLFRNDHFSTIIKHDNKLYTLVTDSGYKDKSLVVWQSVTSVGGKEDGFYDYEFQPHHVSAGDKQDTNDYDMARRLQEKEDARLAREMSERTNNQSRREARTRPNDTTTTPSSVPKKKKNSCTTM